MFDNTHFSRFLCYIPPSPASPAPTPRLLSIFPELSISGGANNMDIAPVIDHRNDDSGSSAMHDAQISEDSNHEAFDYGDEDDPDLYTTEAPMYGLNESQVVIDSLGSQSASRLDGENTHLLNDSVLADPVLYTPSTRSSTPALSYVDDEDPDAATQLSQVLLSNNVPIPHIALDSSILMEQDTEDRSPMTPGLSTPAIEPLIDFLDEFQLESSVSGSPDHTQAMVDSWEILMKEESLPESEDDEALEPPHLSASEPALAASDTYFGISEALNGRTCEAPQSSNSSKEEPDDAIHEVDSPRCSNTGSKDRHGRDSFTSNETHESFESCQSSPQSSPSSLTLPLESRPSTPAPEDRHDLKSDEIPRSDLECPHDIEDSNEQLEYNVDTTTFTLPFDIISASVTPPGSPILEGLSQYMIPGAILRVDANIQPESAATSSTDNDPIVVSEANSILSPSRPSAPASGDHDLNFDDILATIALPVDIIDVTPPGSPILEGLSRFMIPEVLEVNQDNVSTPVQRDIPTGERTLWPSSEAPCFGLPSSSGTEQSPRSAQQATNLPESPGPNAEITIQPDSPYPHHLSHVQVQDSHLEVPTSPLERIQSGLLRLIPTYYALSGETINRTT